MMKSGAVLMLQRVIAALLSQPEMNDSLRTKSSRHESWLNVILGTLSLAVFHIVLTKLTCALRDYVLTDI